MLNELVHYFVLGFGAAVGWWVANLLIGLVRKG